MPSNLFGKVSVGSEYTKTRPRKWVDGEVEWIKSALAEGYSIQDVADASSRSVVSIEIKLKRSNKKNDTYNKRNREKKYYANSLFIDSNNIDSLLDLYAGNSFYLQKDIKHLVTNDIDSKYDTTFNDDAHKLLCKLYAAGETFDVVDLDPYGSAYDCFDLALKVAKKFVVISFGEWGHKRWKRYDFVNPRYSIDSDESFVEENFIAEIERIAAINKKTVEVIDILKYDNFLRVYFKLDRLKITKQWERDNG